MRKFLSYGPLDIDLHYYAPRTALINQICAQLLGDDVDKGGHYTTLWAPRQTGKTWVTNQALDQLQQNYPHFHIAKLNLQDLKDLPAPQVWQALTRKLERALVHPLPLPNTLEEFAEVFSVRVLNKPLILMLDEFDALAAEALQSVVNAFRNIYLQRQQQRTVPSAQKEYLLHGLALIGVRAVLGVENVTGSPFNVQRSVHIPNLTQAEVEGMFHWYERDSGHLIDAAVIARIYDEMRGQPGLTCWLGELLTETYNQGQPVITMQDFDAVYAAALNALPNNNILNIISKARDETYKPLIFSLFETDSKIPFRYDDPLTNFLYLNGVVDLDLATPIERYVKFASPFVQKRLFNYFAYERFGNLGRLYDPFDNLEETITEQTLHIPNFMRRYERYLQQNRHRLLQDAPRRRTDGRIYEAIYHFSLYMYLTQFLATFGGRVHPEFPTGNGKIDLIIHYANQIYGVEVKSFLNPVEYQRALGQAAHYGQRLQLAEFWLIFFVDTIDDENRHRYETTYTDPITAVIVRPLFVITG